MDGSEVTNTITVRKVAQMGDLDDDALRCHAFGHPWNRPPMMQFNYYGFDSRLLLLTCESCGTERRDVREANNPRHLITRLYRYPDDYLCAFPADRMDFVTEWFRRNKAPRRQALAVEGAWKEWVA